MTENQKEEHDHRVRTKRRDVGIYAAVFLLGLVVAWLAWGRLQAEEREQAATESAVSLAERVRAACERDGDTAEELGDAMCAEALHVSEDPVAATVQGPEGPQGLQGVQGPEGPEGPRGPQGAQGPEGPQGPRGDLGPVGPQGEQGQPGVDGLDGLRGLVGFTGEPGVDGESGPAGRDGVDGEDGQDGADGAPGKDGATGDPGRDGRGIESITCPDDTDDWIVEYDDGTSETVPGPCRVEIVPPPEETP